MSSSPVDHPSQPAPPAPSGRALDATLRRSVGWVAGTGVALSLGAGGLFGVAVAPSVLAGGAVAAVNLWAFGHIGRSLLAGGGKGWGVIGLLKMLALFGVAFALFQSGRVSVLPFALGYAALPLGITLSQFFAPPAAGAGDPTGPASPSQGASR
jgi:hypothetical protein